MVDIGCGDGRISAYLAEAGFDVLGIDFAATAVERARGRFGESNNLRLRVLDICKQIPEPGRFDAVFDRGCFHGLPKPLRAAYLHTLIACTRPGTRFLLMVKVTSETDVPAETTVGLTNRALEDLYGTFTSRFDIDRTEPIHFNSRGDDDATGSIPGLALWMTRR